MSTIKINQTDFKKAYAITKDQISDMKYFYWDGVVGLVGIVCQNYGVPLSQDTLDGIKQAIVDDFFGNVEPEWDSYGLWQWWEKLSPDWFQLTTNDIKCNKKPSDFKEENNE